jgi:hypothetical protein
VNPKARREGVGFGKVGLLELEPGEVAHLDHRVLGPAGVLTGQAPLLAMQVVGACGGWSQRLLFVSDDSVTHDDAIVSQA